MTEPKTGRVFRKYGGKHPESLLVIFFFIGAFSFILTGVGLFFLFRDGADTKFPPGDSYVGWTPNPDHRGTANIIWTCLSTIFTCVYVSVHIDIPDPARTEEFKKALLMDTHSANLHKGIRNFPAQVLQGLGRLFLRLFFIHSRFLEWPISQKAIWVLVNICAPEFMVMTSILERQSAKAGVEFMRDRGQKGWTMRHAFFADMGGFRVHGQDPFLSGLQFYKWYDECRPNLDYKAIERDISDRSKANTLLKVYTCAQASLLLIETFWRLLRHQHISELEITTCAYIMCAVPTYFCWLHKPYSVESYITLQSRSSKTVKSSTAVVTPVIKPIIPLLRHTTPVGVCDNRRRESKLPRLFFEGQVGPFNRAYKNPDQSWSLSSHLASLIGAAIGVIHGLPFWHSLFVKSEGQSLWRAACSVQVLLPPLMAFVATVIDRVYVGRITWFWFMFAAVAYCISRTILFALIWVSFLSLPVGVYSSINWSGGWL